MDIRKFIYFERGIAFIVICAIVLWMGIKPGELVWGLYISSMVSGVVALLLPLWVLMLFPELDRKFFPRHEPPGFSAVGRLMACIFLTVVLSGPFLFFMVLFTPWMLEFITLPGIPGNDPSWVSIYKWAAGEFWPVVVMVTVFALYESVVHLLRREPHAFFRPYALIVKMFAIAFISNFGFGVWSIFPIVAILQFPEDFIIRYGDRFGTTRTDD